MASGSLIVRSFLGVAYGEIPTPKTPLASGLGKANIVVVVIVSENECWCRKRASLISERGGTRRRNTALKIKNK